MAATPFSSIFGNEGELSRKCTHKMRVSHNHTCIRNTPHLGSLMSKILLCDDLCGGGCSPSASSAFAAPVRSVPAQAHNLSCVLLAPALQNLRPGQGGMKALVHLMCKI